VAVEQVNDMLHFRAAATPEMKDRFRGIIQTVWTGVDGFLKEFYSKEETGKNTSANCFRATFDQINKSLKH
jgi:hypothetical protein